MANHQITCPSFDRVLILDWYDDVVHGVGHCEATNCWFTLWLVTWQPTKKQPCYALRPVTIEWLDRLMRVINQPARWPYWTPHYEEHSFGLVQSVLDELYGSEPETLLLGAYSDLAALPERCREIDARALGAFAIPRSIEVLSAQTDAEHAAIESLFG